MKKIFSLFLIIMSVVLLSGCGSKNKNEVKGSNQIESCPNCVFSDKYDIDSKTQKIKSYTNDYTTLKDSNGNQRNGFLGYVLNKDETIKKLFTCSIYKEKPFCLETAMDSKSYEKNVEILHSLFGKTVKCEDIDYGIKCSDVYEDKGIVVHSVFKEDTAAYNYITDYDDYDCTSEINTMYKHMECNYKN